MSTIINAIKLHIILTETALVIGGKYFSEKQINEALNFSR